MTNAVVGLTARHRNPRNSTAPNVRAWPPTPACRRSVTADYDPSAVPNPCLNRPRLVGKTRRRERRKPLAKPLHATFLDRPNALTTRESSSPLIRICRLSRPFADRSRGGSPQSVVRRRRRLRTLPRPSRGAACARARGGPAGRAAAPRAAPQMPPAQAVPPRRRRRHTRRRNG